VWMLRELSRGRCNFQTARFDAAPAGRALQCRTPSRGIPLNSESGEMTINCLSDKYMKTLHTIFSVDQKKRGETVQAVASTLVLPALISCQQTF